MCVFSFQTHYTISHALARLGTPYLEGVGAREYWMLPNFLPLALRMFWYGNNIWTNNNVVGSSTTIPAGLVCLRLPRYHTKAACHHPIWIRSLTHRTVLSYMDVLYSTAEQITVCILWNSSSTHHSSACYPLLTGHHKDSPALSESCAVFAQCVMCGKCFEYRCTYKHTLPHPIRRGERISQRSKGLKWNFPSNSSRIRTTSFAGRDALVQLPVCCVARSSLSENNEGGTYYRVMEGVALIRFNQNTWVVLSVYPKGFPQSAL